MDIAEDDEPLSDEAIRGIEESLRDIKAGRLYTLEEARAELAIWRRK
jgi:predicted transcriptional regulator